MSFVVLHLSDLHLTRYGEQLIWSHRDEDEEHEWTLVQAWRRWRVEGTKDRKGRPETLRLVDPEGVVHKEKSWSERGEDRVISQLLSLAMKRHETSAENLIENAPQRGDLGTLLQLEPGNTNLRFLQLMHDVRAIAPDVVLLTGDLTDNGFGYSLVAHHLAPWIEADRLLIVPGNHDTYEMVPRLGRGRIARMKTEAYLAFAATLGQSPGPSGCYLKLLGDVAVVGINSCMMPLTPMSASGAVSEEQLAWISDLGKDPAFRDARLRLALVHHHLLTIPFTVGRRGPIEAGMRLRNAEETMEVLTSAGFDFIFNGHRHHGYVVKLPGRPLVVSSPSSTMGCKSLGRPYAWCVDMAKPQPFPQMVELRWDGPPVPGRLF